MVVKGQIISKGLFGVLEFSQKTNERIRRSSKNEFLRSFFERIRGYQKSFRNYLTFSGFKLIVKYAFLFLLHVRSFNPCISSILMHGKCSLNILWTPAHQNKILTSDYIELGQQK